MATHSFLLSKVPGLLESNEGLFRELKHLDTRRAELEQQLNTHVASLNLVIRCLPEAVDTLLLNEHPASKTSLVTILKNGLLSPLSLQPTEATLSTLENKISEIRIIDTALRSSEQSGKGDAYKAADLTSRLAVQSVDCSTILQQISDERSNKDKSLSNVNTRIREATESIERNRILSNQMSTQAGHHDQEASHFDNVGKCTWFIPGINLITIPIALIGSSVHGNKASEYRALQSASESEIKDNESQKVVLEQEMSQLDTALRELSEAISHCSASERQASQFKDQTKILLDQYGRISDHLKQVIKSLDVVESDFISNPLNWDTSRYIVLHSILHMVTTLHEGGFLEEFNHALLRRLKAIEMPGTQTPLMEVEW